MLGHVAHALERSAHAQRRDDDAQVARDGLLPGEDLDGELVELDRLLVDDRVGLDDLFGQGDVTRAERAGGAVDGDGHEVGDLDQAVLNVLEGLVEYFAHAGTFLVGGTAHRCPATSGDSVQRRLTSGAVTVNSSVRATAGGGERRVKPNAPLYAGGMEQPQLALLSLLAGVLIGAAVVGLVVGALKARDRSLAQTTVDVPEGVDAMLEAMDDPAFVCDMSSTVLALSPAAAVFGVQAGRSSPATISSAWHASRATRVRGLGESAPSARHRPRGGPARGGAGDADLEPAHPRRAARHHRARAGRGDAPRLRGQHEPRAEDTGRRREPVGRGDRVGGGRPRPGPPFRRAHAGRGGPAERPGQSHSEPVAPRRPRSCATCATCRSTRS